MATDNRGVVVGGELEDGADETGPVTGDGPAEGARVPPDTEVGPFRRRWRSSRTVRLGLTLGPMALLWLVVGATTGRWIGASLALGALAVLNAYAVWNYTPRGDPDVVVNTWMSGTGFGPGH